MNGQLLNGGYFPVEELSFLQLNMVKTDLMREGKIMKEQDILEAVEKMRIDWKKNDDKRDSGLPHDLPEIKRVDDIQYGNDPKWNLLDIYLPKNKFPLSLIFMEVVGFTVLKKPINFMD